MLNSEWIQAQATALAQQVGEWGENDRQCLADFIGDVIRVIQIQKNRSIAWNCFAPCNRRKIRKRPGASLSTPF